MSSDLSEKYDRQLRLWGSNGQRNLMDSHILLVNANAVGTETLKNLVLPGVGNFTVLDADIVMESDLGSNFFVCSEQLGMPRSQAVAELLSEMNPDVCGHHKIGVAGDILAKEPDFFSQFTLIIAANPTPDVSQLLASLCWRQSIPFLLLRSYGLIGSAQLQVGLLEILESKSETDQLDLRLANPFEDLLLFSRSFELSALNGNELSHVPWPVLLLLAMDKWMSLNGSAWPKTRTEKESFKRLLSDLVCGDGEKVNGVPENLREALRESFRIFAPRPVPDTLLGLLVHPDTLNLTSQSSDFRILLHAVNVFRETYGGDLPLPGTLPDMTSSTTSFIALQKIFHKKATEDRSRLAEIVDTLLQTIGRPASSVSVSTIELFCKNILGLRVVSTQPLAQENRTSPPTDGVDADVDLACDVMAEANEGEAPDQTPLLWYLALRAVDTFWETEKRWPGTLDEQLERDVDSVWSTMQSLGQASGVAGCLTRDHAVEIVRYGACELHTIASLVGGVAAQEAVKVMTKQYVSLNNTFVFNGIAGRGSVYRL